MATSTDLIKRALQRMNKLPAGQNVSSEQTTKMTNSLNAVLEKVIERNVADYASVADMPLKDEDPFVTLMAWNARLDFSVSQERFLALSQAQEEAWTELYRNHTVSSDGEPVEAQYF